MAFSVKVQNDAFPEDTEFEIMGLGLFKNGEQREISEDEERSFIARNQQNLDEAIGDNKNVTISGSAHVSNLDDVLGRNISDTMAVPEPADEEAPAESTTANENTVELPSTVTTEGGGT